MMVLALTQADVVNYLEWGALGIALLVLLTILLTLLAVIGLGAKWTRRQFALADAALVPFGQTPVGGLVHGAVTELTTQVDETSDPYVKAVHGAATSIVTALVNAVVPQYLEQAKTAISVEHVQSFLMQLVAGLAELTDGAPVSEDDIPTASYGVPEPDIAVSMVPEQEHIPADGPGEATK